MSQIQTYEGISRDKSPEWFGWIILDLLNERHNETDEHVAEIKKQLDFEVMMFFKSA